jgi:hypothetical protein
MSLIFVNWEMKCILSAFRSFISALKCENPNMIYMVSGTGCPATCTDPTAPSKCTIEAREGCFCKPGFVLSDDKCIKQEECGCKDSNGDYFPVSINQGEFGCKDRIGNCIPISIN